MKNIFLIIIASLLISGCWNTGNGTHTGIITAAKSSGILFKTYSVYFQSSVYSSKAIKYCVTNKKIYEKLSYYSITQKQVTIYFHSEYIISPIRCDNESTIIDRVEAKK